MAIKIKQEMTQESTINPIVNVFESRHAENISEEELFKLIKNIRNMEKTIKQIK